MRFYHVFCIWCLAFAVHPPPQTHTHTHSLTPVQRRAEIRAEAEAYTRNNTWETVRRSPPPARTHPQRPRVPQIWQNSVRNLVEWNMSMRPRPRPLTPRPPPPPAPPKPPSAPRPHHVMSESLAKAAAPWPRRAAQERAAKAAKAAAAVVVEPPQGSVRRAPQEVAPAAAAGGGSGGGGGGGGGCGGTGLARTGPGNSLAACCGFDLCHKYILYLYLYLYLAGWLLLSRCVCFYLYCVLGAAPNVSCSELGFSVNPVVASRVSWFVPPAATNPCAPCAAARSHASGPWATRSATHFRRARRRRGRRWGVFWVRDCSLRTEAAVPCRRA